MKQYIYVIIFTINRQFVFNLYYLQQIYIRHNGRNRIIQTVQK